MPTARRLLSNFTKGQFSPLMECRPDLAAYFEGAKEITNYQLLRQGGLQRRPGLRYVATVKDSTADTILLPVEISVDAAFIVEMGNLYARFYKNKAPVTASAAGPPYEISTQYATADLRLIHYTQSADVMFLFHGSYAQATLNHVSDANWSQAITVYKPPPSFEKDTDIGTAAAATLTPGATTGTGITFTASAACFLAADSGRQIIFGASVAVITGYTSTTVVTADILVDFPNTNPIAVGSWLLRLSPQAGNTPSKARPIGTIITMTLDLAGWRAADVGKYVTIYGGLVKITVYTSTTIVSGQILSEMGDVTGTPAKDPAGAWSLQVASWNVTDGYPRTGEFFQGRLGQAGTLSQPTTTWLSASDAYNNYAVGSLADNAIEYTIASRRLDRLEWLGENIDLYIGSTGAILRMQGGNVGQPIGGDVIPLVTRLLSDGCAPMQPININRHTLYMDRNLKKFFDMAYSFLTGEMDSTELTAVAENIFGDGVLQGQMAFQKRPDPRLYWVRQDGALVTLTYYPVEKVVGFTVFQSPGSSGTDTFQSCAVIPGATGESDQVWVVVKRTLNGATVRTVELLETNASEMAGRLWTSLQTDCAILYNGSATATITGLSTLEGCTVDVVADGIFVGTSVVTGGQITLLQAASQVEVGLHYDSVVTTMRPALQDAMIEGLPRSWVKLWLRLYQTIGGSVRFSYSTKDLLIPYAANPLDQNALFTGDTPEMKDAGTDTDARITVKQTQPYPMTLLGLFGELTVGEHG